MALKKVLFGSWGAASVGAAGCVNATVFSNIGDCQATEGDCEGTDVAVDAPGTVWFTTTPNFGISPAFPSKCSKVWMCPADEECISIEGNWTLPSGIAVDNSDAHQTIVYISDQGGGQNHPTDPEIRPGVKKCTVIGQTLDCLPFGDSWDIPQRLAVDHLGHVFVTNGHTYRPSYLPPVKSHGVWNCSPSADCVLVGGSDRWPAQNDNEGGVATDYLGNVYVTGIHDSSGGSPPESFVEKCTSSGPDGQGICEDFGPQYRSSEYLGLAVGSDASVYIRENDRLTRCSPVGDCRDVGAIAFYSSGAMAIDRNGAIYSFKDEACQLDSPGSKMRLALHKFCIDPPADVFQV